MLPSRLDYYPGTDFLIDNVRFPLDRVGAFRNPAAVVDQPLLLAAFLCALEPAAVTVPVLTFLHAIA